MKLTPKINFYNLNSNTKNENEISEMEATVEPKLQPIFMKMVENYIKIIEEIEQERNTKFKKKVNGELVQIYPNDISE